MSVDDARFELELGSSGYPSLLAQSPSPPQRLYGVGDPDALRAGLAVIGARRSTPYGIRCAHLFAGWAGGAGYVVVSGAARGCDQTAQLAAIDAGGTSVAVMGCGADVDYPSSSRTLLERLRGGEGAVVSELPWGAPPVRWAFARRNRIIAGLSAAVLVVEAGLPSGTFSTADHALDAGREVLVVPGSIWAPECRGSNRLLRQGAFPVTDVSELYASIRGSLGDACDNAPSPSRAPAPEADPLIAALRADPMRPDDIARAMGLDIVAVVRRIGELETNGLVQRYPDGRYAAR